MKYILPLFILLSPFNVSSKEISVNSISNGSCWVEKSDEHIKVASFNDNNSVTLSGFLLADFMEQVKEKMKDEYQVDFMPKTLDIMAHCGTYGSSLIFNFNHSEQSICLWTSFKDGQLSFDKITPAHNGQRGFCDGLVAGSFIVKPVDGQKMFDVLEGDEWKSRIDSVTRVIDGVYKLQFSSKEHFDGDKIHKELQELGLFKSVDFNSFNHPVGEQMMLLERDLE